MASVIFSFRKIGLSDRCAAATEATASRATPAELTLNCFDKLRVEAGCSEAIMLLNEIKDDLSRLAGFRVRVFSRASLRRWAYQKLEEGAHTRAELAAIPRVVQAKDRTGWRPVVRHLSSRPRDHRHPSVTREV